MTSFHDRLADSRPILLDGATGTELNRRDVDTSLPLWSARALLDAPDTLLQIHLDYLEAGADVITSNTFRTHARSLAHAGLEDQAGRLTRLAVEIARQAIEQLPLSSQKSRLVAGSISPLEDCYSPQLVPTQEACLHEHRQMVKNLAAAGADFLLIETMNTIREAQAAAQAAQETNLPFIVSFTCGVDGNLLSGESIAQAALALEPFKPAALSINCSPAASIHTFVTELRASTELPIGVYANIGYADHTHGWNSSNDISPIGYAQLSSDWLDIAAPAIIGGCCGTTPKHISALYDLIENTQE